MIEVGFDAAMQTFISGLSRESGSLLLDYFRRGALHHEAKGEWDLVTEADRAAERAIINAIRGRFPGHDVLGEESGLSGTTRRHRWLIDPLDGTINFAHGIHTWGVSIALSVDGEVEYGAFYDPMHDEFFYAQRGCGATLNGRPAQTSGLTDAAQAIVYCSIAHGDGAEITQRNARHLWSRVMRLRMTGSIGNALANVAVGRMDAAIEVRGGAWDHAAGALLVSESGGIATTFEGSRMTAAADTVLATATSRLHNSLSAILAGSFQISG